MRALSNRRPMSMSEILSVLVSKANTEAEEAMRGLVSSLNGIAGLQQIQGEPAKAVAAYREACAAWEEGVRQGVRSRA